MSPSHCRWLAWSVWAVCVVLSRGVALVLDFTTEELPLGIGVVQIRSWLRRTHGGAVAGVPGGWRADRLTATVQTRSAGSSVGLGDASTQLQRFAMAYADHALLETFALPWGEVRGLVSATWIELLGLLDPSGILLMLLFPRRTATVSVGGGSCRWVTVLGSRHERAWGRAFMPGILLSPQQRGKPLFAIVGVIYGRLTTYGFFGVSRSFWA